jgi:hypothetical protein
MGNAWREKMNDRISIALVSLLIIISFIGGWHAHAVNHPYRVFRPFRTADGDYSCQFEMEGGGKGGRVYCPKKWLKPGQKDALEADWEKWNKQIEEESKKHE